MLSRNNLCVMLGLLLADIGPIAAADPQTATSSRPAIQVEAIQVEYVHPEHFTDVGARYMSDARSRSAYLEPLSAHLMQAAAGRILPGQTLTVSITDVDMAGDFEPWRLNLADTRIIRDVYPPRINLRFRLTDAAGTVVQEGDRVLRDLAFQMKTAPYRNDRFRYEKALVDTWVEHEFALRRR